MAKKTLKADIKVKGVDLLRKVKELIHEGNVRKIIIKDGDGKVFVEIPLNVGVVGAFLLPVWAAVGALAAMASDFSIQVIRKDD
ncbi:MAG: DUF4342 domain-containing protein [Elusimicrobia bacterium]|nr:DUF4342 domain-containing protein [Elusimicrobiota bacterium]